MLQHLTRVTSNIDAGAELLYQASPMMPGGHVAILSIVAKYRGKMSILNIKNDFKCFVFVLIIYRFGLV